MKNAGTWKVDASQTLHPFPCPARPTTLAAAADHLEPQTSYLVHKTTDAVTVARHGVIIQPALNNASKPAARFTKWRVHPLSQLILDRSPGCTHTFRHTMTMDREPALRSRPGTLVGEALKVKRLGPTLATRGSSFDRIAAELAVQPT